MDRAKSSRNPLLDMARIVAVLAVVMIHCSADFIANYPLHTSEFIWGNLFDSVARMGVPLFLMISGALFLDQDRDISFKSILSKNVKSLAIITVIWAALYAVLYHVIIPLLTNQAVSIKGLVSGVLQGHYHMWYLYMIIGIYIATVFLRSFVCKKNKNMVLLFILVSFVAQFLFTTVDKIGTLHFGIDFAGGWIEKFHLDFFSGYVTYYLLGWYLVHVGIQRKYLRYVIYCLSLLSLLAIVFYVGFTGNHAIAYDNIGLLVFLYSSGVFLAINNVKISFKEKTARILATLSKLSFGVYILHVIVLTAFKALLPYREHGAAYILLCFVTVCAVSFSGSYIVSKIPVLKHLVKA